MRSGIRLRETVSGGALLLFCALLMPRIAYAYCDSLDGPVIKTARAALEKGDVTPVLK